MSLDKAALSAEIADVWAALDDYLNSLSDEQLSGARDAAGWRVSDHVTHLAAWENSVLLFLQGQPRYVGLGVPRELFVSSGIDAINADIQRQWQSLTFIEARARFGEIHKQMLKELAPLSDEDLAKANSEYALSASGEYDSRPVINTIYNNTAHHYREHQGWIETMVSKGQENINRR